MKSWSSSLELVVVVMVAGLCSCSVPTDTGNGNENTNANSNENVNANENTNTNENGRIEAGFVIFEDPDSDFTTTEVMDIDREIVRLDSVEGELVFAEDGTTDSGWDIDGNLLSNGFFTVAFGTENGQRGAYFTETARATICDISASGGTIQIFATNTLVPQE